MCRDSPCPCFFYPIYIRWNRYLKINIAIYFHLYRFPITWNIVFILCQYNSRLFSRLINSYGFGQSVAKNSNRSFPLFKVCILGNIKWKHCCLKCASFLECYPILAVFSYFIFIVDIGFDFNYRNSSIGVHFNFGRCNSQGILLFLRYDKFSRNRSTCKSKRCISFIWIIILCYLESDLFVVSSTRFRCRTPWFAARQFPLSICGSSAIIEIKPNSFRSSRWFKGQCVGGQPHSCYGWFWIWVGVVFCFAFRATANHHCSKHK